MASDRVVVFGATGLVGSYAVTALRDAGVSPVAAVRKPSEVEGAVVVDLEADPATWPQELFAGVSAVVVSLGTTRAASGKEGRAWRGAFCPSWR